MNKHVDFSKEDVVVVSHRQLGKFIKQSRENTDNHKYRYCMHDSPENILQEMFIVRTKGEYYRPDKHTDMPETHLLIKGREAILLFDETGNICDMFLLDENNILAYRINKSIYHMTIALTDSAIDYEIKPGPFRSEVNEYPDWAPTYEDKKGIDIFMGKVLSEIEKNGNYFNLDYSRQCQKDG